jgi:hypothetical protein
MRGSRVLSPGWLVSRVVNPLLRRLGVVPTLAVRGRTSGRWRTIPVNVLEFEGQRYLVAPRGDTQWVRTCERRGVTSFVDVTWPNRSDARAWGGPASGVLCNIGNGLAADSNFLQVMRPPWS